MNKYQPKKPLPGSPAAILQGCTCPRMDNCGGLGYAEINGVTHYIMDSECPLHGLAEYSIAEEHPPAGGEERQGQGMAKHYGKRVYRCTNTA